MADAKLHALLENALGLCQAGAYSQAESLYRALTVGYPDAPDVWNMLAVVLYQQGAFENAAEAAARATGLRPAIAPYWVVRGNIAMSRRLHADARQYFAEALATQPEFAEAHYRLALSLHAVWRLPEAIAAYREAARLAPEVAEIYWHLAEALIANGEVNGAMHAYQQAFVRDPGGALDRSGCFEWLGRLHFETLPAEWHGELERFFSRADLDTRPYVRAGLNALKTKPPVRAALTQAASAPIVIDAALRSALQEPLFQALLCKFLVADPQFERLLTRLRALLLLDRQARESAPFSLLCSLALQCFNNEFVFTQNAEEETGVAALRASVEAELGGTGRVSDPLVRSLLVAGCYRSIESIEGIERLLDGEADGKVHGQALSLVMQRCVIDRRIERGLRERIESISPTTDTTSQAVRAMYEEHPYPRWFAIRREEPVSVRDLLERELPALPRLPSLERDAPRAVRVLVAGCGTGHDAIWLASNIARSRVLGIDLSLSSLAYARRMADAMNIANVEFRQGDILQMGRGDNGSQPGERGEPEERFDVIASTGVLHHMHDPLAGLRVLAGLLVPGGVMKLGFYSARARVSVNAAREIIAKLGIQSVEPEIRAFRQRVFAAGPGSPLKELELSDDFYSMSMCRDLLFHVEEHQYTLPQLADMLRELDLELLGLSDLPQDVLGRYGRMFPTDTRMIDIESWETFEQQHPDTFSHMFLFWCRPTAAVTRRGSAG